MNKTVTVRNLVLGEGTPKICLPLTGETEEELEGQLNDLKKFPYDLVEWRGDYFQEISSILSAKRMLEKLRASLKDTPLLFTFRTRAEGGMQTLSEKDYLELNLELLSSGLIDLIDVEFFLEQSTVGRLLLSARAAGVRVILSNHDFKKTPAKEDLVNRLKAMYQMGADIPKIAVMPTCKEDVLTLLLATQEVSSLPFFPPIITMSMGTMGVISRLLGEFSGSCVTFGTAGSASAPGQIASDKLKELLKQLHEVL